MGVEAHSSEPADGLARVRTHLLTSMHLGRLKPGDRVPSVRRMAALTGLNRKTVHRAYLKLAHEGLLQSRQGSGTFLTDDSRGPLEKPAPRRLLDAVSRCRDEARSLGLTPSAFGRYFSLFIGEALRGVPIAVVECNREQIGLISHDVAAALNCQTRGVLLADLLRSPASALGDARAVITTDCHRHEVNDAVLPLGLPIYRVALDVEFPQALIQRARQTPVVMVVRDLSFDGPWRRLLKQLKVPQEVAERFVITDPRGLLTVMRSLRTRPSIYVSTLVEGEIAAGMLDRAARIAPGRYVDAASVERLKAMALLDLVAEISADRPVPVTPIAGRVVPEMPLGGSSPSSSVAH